jgi:hypothetical protein
LGKWKCREQREIFLECNYRLENITYTIQNNVQQILVE